MEAFFMRSSQPDTNPELKSANYPDCSGAPAVAFFKHIPKNRCWIAISLGIFRQVTQFYNQQYSFPTFN